MRRSWTASEPQTSRKSCMVYTMCWMRDDFRYTSCRQETLDRLEDVVNREVDQVRRCMTPHQRSDVTLYDGRVVEGPLMDWGTSSCWPTGSDSFISKDFVVRGVYYPQLVRLFQFLNPVSCSSIYEPGSLFRVILSMFCARSPHRTTC